MINKIGNITLLTNLSTASGFAAFVLTSSQTLKEFGVIASMNIMLIFLLSLILIPIALSYLDPPKRKHTQHTPHMSHGVSGVCTPPSRKKLFLSEPGTL